jgi:hypothetical protein
MDSAALCYNVGHLTLSQNNLTGTIHVHFCVGIIEQSMEARNRVVVPARHLCSLADRCENLIPTWFLAPIDGSSTVLVVRSMNC